MRRRGVPARASSTVSRHGDVERPVMPFERAASQLGVARLVLDEQDAKGLRRHGPPRPSSRIGNAAVSARETRTPAAGRATARKAHEISAILPRSADGDRAASLRGMSGAKAHIVPTDVDTSRHAAGAGDACPSCSSRYSRSGSGASSPLHGVECLIRGPQGHERRAARRAVRIRAPQASRGRDRPGVHRHGARRGRAASGRPCGST